MTRQSVRFGVMADVHLDFMYQAGPRLKRFVERMNYEQVDFVIQLGDFCYPLPENRFFMDIWEAFKGPRFHVLGNHDMDVCDKAAVMAYWGMERNYYSFDSGSYHFVVLDGNYLRIDGEFVDYEYGNYHRFPEANNHLTPEQLNWLRADLAATDKQTVIFCHQSLETPYLSGIHNHDEFRAILREANENAKFQKVIACLNGHLHLDGVRVIDDIYYIQINSMSYYYMGKSYETIRYSEEITASHRLLSRCAPYEEGLYAIVTLEPGLLAIQGTETSYVGPSPLECGHPNVACGHVLTPRISSRRLPVWAK
ncbi:metallophosphoesterase family protein [Paenibacillus sp. GYB003]|uniref:metallophosphoesterase family protein n=1 Tax=Paenibacillus sp. GYB003 TaxID=2994392 RepID=UPI002F96A8D1